MQGFLLAALHSQAFYPGAVVKPHHTTSMFRICAVSTSSTLNLDVFLGSPSSHRVSLVLGGGSIGNSVIKWMSQINISLIRSGQVSVSALALVWLENKLVQLINPAKNCGGF